MLLENPNISYNGCADTVVNSHGRKLLRICKATNVIVVNNLHTADIHFRGGLSFRKKQRWLSEIDLCLCSVITVERIHDITVNKDLLMPSDHAPLSVTLLYQHVIEPSELYRSTVELTDYSHFNASVRKIFCKRAIRMGDMNQELFMSHIQAVQLQDLDPHNINVDQLVSGLNELFYSVAKKSKIDRSYNGGNNNHLDRWDRLIRENYPKTI